MPAKSKKQKKFMQAVANNPEFAKKVGVKQSVGKEFTKEKGMKKVKKMMGGGMTAPGMKAPGMAGMAGAQAMDPRMQMAMEAQRQQAAMGGMKEGGKVKKGKSTDESTVLFNKVKNEVKKSTGPEKNISAMTSARMGAKNKMKKDFVSGYGRVYDMEEKRKNEYKTGSKNVKPKAMKKGGAVKGSASKRADGIATKGHTRGRMV
jgi:hypothetical protein